MSKCITFLFVLFALSGLLLSCGGQPEGGGKGGAAGKPQEQPEEKPLDPDAYGKHPVVEFRTSEGNFKAEFNAEKAPRTVRTILTYCLNGFYEGTVFHRIIPGFVAQGGGMEKTASGALKPRTPPLPPIPDENDNGLEHVRGALSMAKVPGRLATCQFFILYDRKPHLDGVHTVFGKVIEGMEVVDRWAKLAKGKKLMPQDMPVIEKVVVSKGNG
jgi:cyclophilin family peptidyl-prolyl cis-trans isomerase